MNLEVRHLRLVTAIADHGSVTKAANQLNLTQSALSHQLRDIEDRLGAPLFQRLSRKMILTPVGERLLESARTILDELDRVEDEIQDKSKQRQGILRMSTECYTCYHWLPSRLKPFNEAYPRVEVRIIADATRKPFEALLEGRLDVAVVSTKVRNQKLVYKPIFKDEVVALMSPDHRFASKPHLRAEDFRTEHLLVYNAPKESLIAYQKLFIPAGVSPREVTHIELTEAILEMAKAGLGVGVMARWAAAPYVESGALAAVRLTRRGIQRTWSAVTLRNNSAPHYIGDFIKLLATKFDPSDVAYASRNR